MKVMTDKQYEEMKKARAAFWAVLGSFILRFGFLLAVMYIGMAYMVGGGTLQCDFF